MFVMPALKTKTVKAFGQEVIVSEMGAFDKLDFIEYKEKLDSDGINERKAGVLLGAFLMVKCVVNEDGTRIYEDTSVDELARKVSDITSLNIVSDAAVELNDLAAGKQQAKAKN